VVHASWRGGDGAVIVEAFDDHGALPSRIAKTRLSHPALSGAASDRAVNGANGHQREVANLLNIAPEAGRAGVDVPRLLGESQLRERPVLIESALHGDPAAAWLAGHPERLPDVLSALVDWLESWNSATCVNRPLTRDLLMDALLRPAAALDDELDAGWDYFGWLETICESLEGRDVPLVAAHNDLTMVNVLIANDGGTGGRMRLGVIDWENASANNLPLGDFFYAAVDAVAATRDYADRHAAFDACFITGGAWTELVGTLARRLRCNLNIPEDVATLCFHACWLQYAEQAREQPAGKEAHQFLHIAQTLAQRTAIETHNLQPATEPAALARNLPSGGAAR
jgi:hypothetical protein